MLATDCQKAHVDRGDGQASLAISSGATADQVVVDGSYASTALR
jgi:hypothetical protein